MIQIVVLSFVINVVLACPSYETFPCSCTPIGSGKHTAAVTCTNVDDETNFEYSLNRMMATPVRYLTIIDSNIQYLPYDIFKGLKIEYLILSDTTMISLSDTDIAFEGLENSLTSLFIQECILLGGLDWNQLRNLTKLDTLKTVKLGLESIDGEIKALAGLSLSKLLITQDTISYISDAAFADFDKLSVLSLKYNMIEDIKRSMFPDPAVELKTLILGQNKIAHLPPDLFNNMPKLVTVVLAENQLITMSEATFAPVWHQLNKIDMSGNPLRCDCRMLWMTKFKFPINTWGECAEPSNLKNKEMSQLSKADLWC